MTHEAVTVRTLILVPPTVVYRALVEPEALCTWFSEFADSALEDGRFAFWGRHTPYGDVPRQRLVSYGWDRSLRFVWSVPDLDTDVDIDISSTDNDDTVITVRQAPVPEAVDWGAGLDYFWRLATANLASFAEGRHIGPRYDDARPVAGMARSEIVIDAPADEICRALVEADSRGVILAASGTGMCRVLSVPLVDPPRRVAWRWRHPGRLDTTVRWTLVPSGMETRVVVRHENPAEGEYGYQVFWQIVLVNLQRMIELGDTWWPVEAQVS
jgi:uncharacterized protein YndB with AHSA1/START domain